MFLAGDSQDLRKRRILSFLDKSEPGISLLLAAVNFEWTVYRAVLFLSETPNKELRWNMRKFYSLDGYKDLWKKEVETIGSRKRLTVIVRNWSSVCDAFEARNRLVHGRDRYTRKMAKPHIDALLEGVGYVQSYCCLLGISLNNRMPIRRKRPVEAHGGG